MSKVTPLTGNTSKYRKLYLGAALTVLLGTLFPTAAPVFAGARECNNFCQHAVYKRAGAEIRDGIAIIDKLDTTQTWKIARILSKGPRGANCRDVVQLALLEVDPFSGRRLLGRIDELPARSEKFVLEYLGDRVQQRVDQISIEKHGGPSPALEFAFDWLAESLPHIGDRSKRDFDGALPNFFERLQQASSDEELKRIFLVIRRLGEVQRSMIADLSFVELNLLRDHLLAGRHAQILTDDRGKFWLTGLHFADVDSQERALAKINMGKPLSDIIEFLYGEGEAGHVYRGFVREESDKILRSMRYELAAVKWPMPKNDFLPDSTKKQLHGNLPLPDNLPAGLSERLKALSLVGSGTIPQSGRLVGAASGGGPTPEPGLPEDRVRGEGSPVDRIKPRIKGPLRIGRVGR